jgi:glutamate-1-semialdehyde 2,1-aminomutase
VSNRYKGSRAAYERARVRLPGGVNSPVRALKSVGGSPAFMVRGTGPTLIDVDGNEYVDYVGAYGPLVLGHAHPDVVSAIGEALASGTALGAPTERETRLAESIAALVPSMERLRLVNSGTEATMSAIRVARGATGRARIIKFNGCYHGHADSLLVKAGSGAMTFGQPDSAGVPAGTAADTLVAEFNDLGGLGDLLNRHGTEVAAVIVEPVPGNMGVIPPASGFLTGVRDLCDRHGALLIFDEVMSGFRVALGGAQALYGVTPDLTCLGKVIGGGLPVGAYGGRSDLMATVAPEGPVYQAGTLSGNPLSVAAGIATLDAISSDGVFDALVGTTRRLVAGIQDVADQAGVCVTIQHVGSMFTVFVRSDGDRSPLTDLEDVKRCDFEAFSTYYHAMRDSGVNLPPSQYEACFVSTAHDDAAVQNTLDAARVAFERLSD